MAAGDTRNGGNTTEQLPPRVEDGTARFSLCYRGTVEDASSVLPPSVQRRFIYGYSRQRHPFDTRLLYGTTASYTNHGRSNGLRGQSSFDSSVDGGNVDNLRRVSSG
ncbi:hypothetical protein E3N88_17655 [Mikania micrantha]|uniref:Uncharacterized protein n=1 Tax=Mikania micrantha TaxID=192012 RepID=A0A5N6NTU9_9ASTR|nr:hypothetical protein E3N88_17655 [Mikania micrantha]